MARAVSFGDDIYVYGVKSKYRVVGGKIALGHMMVQYATATQWTERNGPRETMKYNSGSKIPKKGLYPAEDTGMSKYVHGHVRRDELAWNAKKKCWIQMDPDMDLFDE